MHTKYTHKYTDKYTHTKKHTNTHTITHTNAHINTHTKWHKHARTRTHAHTYPKTMKHIQTQSRNVHAFVWVSLFLVLHCWCVIVCTYVISLFVIVYVSLCASNETYTILLGLCKVLKRNTESILLL